MNNVTKVPDYSGLSSLAVIEWFLESLHFMFCYPATCGLIAKHKGVVDGGRHHASLLFELGYRTDWGLNEYP